MGGVCIIPNECNENYVKIKTFRYDSLTNEVIENKLEDKIPLPIYQKYLPSCQKKENNFSKDLLKEINQVRFNSKAYSKKIENFANNLKTNFFTKEKYFLFENYPIYINVGEKEFTECSAFLNKLYLENKNLSELEILEELKVPFPEDINNWDDDKYIKNTLKKLYENKKIKLDLVEFSYFIGINNPEILVILSLLNKDVSKNSIRSTIFMTDIKNVGINYKNIEENYNVFYISFAR